MDLTAEEQEYYNALFAVIGVYRKYGKECAINMLTHKPCNVPRPRARQMFYEAINLFFLDDAVENRARRSLIYDNLMKAAQVVLNTAKNSKDMEVYGNLQVQAWKVKQLDKEDPVKREQPKEKPIKIYTTDSNKIGIPSINRHELEAQINNIVDISEKDRERLKQDAGVSDITFEEILDDTEDKTQDYG